MPPPGPAYRQIRYAVMLTTDTSSTDVNVGLYDGSFCWISDKFSGSIAGSGIPLNPVTGLPQTLWKPGIFVKEQLGNPSFTINLQGLGSYGEVSGLSIRIKNTSLFSEYILTTLQGKIFKRLVKFFVVTDDTDETNSNCTFNQFWTGVVDRVDYNELVLTIGCVDNSKEIHKAFPPRKYDKISFPLIQEDIVDKAGVVSIGKVTYAKTMPIEGGASKLVVYQSLGIDYFLTVVSNIDNEKEFYIKTGDKIFYQFELEGKFLRCIEEGPSMAVRIESNLVSAGGLTKIFLQDAFVDTNNMLLTPEPLFTYGNSDAVTDRILFNLSAPFSNLVNGDRIKFIIAPGGTLTTVEYYVRGRNTTGFQISGAPTGPLINITSSIIVQWIKVDNKAWWFEIIDAGKSRAISENPIYSFELSPENNLPIVKMWDENFKKFTNAFGGIKAFYKDGLPGYIPMPGVQFSTVSPDDGGRVLGTWNSYITPEKIYIRNIDVRNYAGGTTGVSLISSNFPAIDSDCPNLYDKDDSTGYTATFQSTAANVAPAGFNPIMAPSFTFDLQIDLGSFLETINSIAVGIRATFSLTDSTNDKLLFYGAPTSLSIIDIFDSEGVRLNNNSGILLPFIFGQVVNNGSARALFINDKYFGLNTSAGIDNARYLNFVSPDIKMLNKAKFIRFKMGFSFSDQISTPSDPTYSMAVFISEICVTKNLKTQSKIEDIYLKIQGEEFSDTWGGRRTAGNPVIFLSDAIEFIMRQYDQAGSYVDTTTFDEVLALMGANQFIGRQVIDRKESSVEYLEELCKHGMLVITPLHNGKKALRSMGIAQFPFTGMTFNESIIIKESLSEMRETPIYKCHNEFVLNYDLNPENGKYQKNLSIKNVDQPVFPAADLPIGTELTFNLASTIYTGYLLINDGTNKRLAIYFGSIISPEVGQRFTLVGGFGGFSFSRMAANVKGFVAGGTSGHFIIIEFGSPIGSLVPDTLYQTGTLTYWDSKILKWTEYAGGFDSYDQGQALWQPCADAWAVTRTKQTLVLDLPWFTDLQTDWGVLDIAGTGPNMLLQGLIANVLRPRKLETFKLPITTSTLALEVGQNHRFNDQKLTAGITRNCWIEAIRLNTKDDLLELDILIDPWNTV